MSNEIFGGTHSYEIELGFLMLLNVVDSSSLALSFRECYIIFSLKEQH